MVTGHPNVAEVDGEAVDLQAKFPDGELIPGDHCHLGPKQT